MGAKELPSSIGGTVASTGVEPEEAVPPLPPNGSSELKVKIVSLVPVLETIFEDWMQQLRNGGRPSPVSPTSPKQPESKYLRNSQVSS